MALVDRRLVALDQQLRTASLPIDGVVLVDPATVPPTVQILYRPEATAAQQTQGAGIVGAFDWSLPADDAWSLEEGRARAKAYPTGRGPWAIALRARDALLLDEINILRTALALPVRTGAQLKTALDAKIDSGAVDT